MIEIEGKVISSELFRRRFVCDIAKCKGDCCYYGDAGAPLEEEELDQLTDNYESFLPYMTERGKLEADSQGLWVKDADGDLVTPIIDGKECIYAIREDNGTWACAIEKAFLDGKSAFRKPISCYLYPIRVTKYARYETLNFHEWDVCKVALELGEKTGTPAYKFLRDPIISKWGKDFYDELEVAEQELRKAGMI